MDDNQKTFFKLVADYYDIADISTIVEVGARDCNESIFFAKKFPKAHIYSFECNPQTLPLCRKAVKGKKNITLIEKAVAEKNGKISFFAIDPKKTTTTWKDGNPGASSLLEASGKYPVEKYVQNKITVDATRLDSFMMESKVNHIDLLWMDIQGAELMALKSFGERIKDVSIIHTEVEFMEIYKDQPLFPNIKRFLNSQGFTFLDFSYECEFFGDAIFIRNDLLKKKGLATYFRHKSNDLVAPLLHRSRR